MIHLYKKYHTAYICIGVVLIVCMVVSMFLLWSKFWFAPLVTFSPTLIRTTTTTGMMIGISKFTGV